MHDLYAKTAFASRTPKQTAIGGLSLTERPDVALASVSARMGTETDCAQKLATLTGLEVPGPGCATLSDTRGLMWIGPDQWLFEASADPAEALSDRVTDALGKAASVTDQTDAWVRFDIEGAECTAMFALLTVLDVPAMAAGACNRTSIHHVGSLLVCRQERTAFSLYAPRSFAVSVHHALCRAARTVD